MPLQGRWLVRGGGGSFACCNLVGVDAKTSWGEGGWERGRERERHT